MYYVPGIRSTFQPIYDINEWNDFVKQKYVRTYVC